MDALCSLLFFFACHQNHGCVLSRGVERLRASSIWTSLRIMFCGDVDVVASFCEMRVSIPSLLPSISMSSLFYSFSFFARVQRRIDRSGRGRVRLDRRVVREKRDAAQRPQGGRGGEGCRCSHCLKALDGADSQSDLSLDRAPFVQPLMTRFLDCVCARVERPCTNSGRFWSERVACVCASAF